MRLIFEAGFNLDDVGELKLAVVETGGASFSVTIATGQFFLTVDGATLTDGTFEDGYHPDLVTPYRSLLAALKTALDAGGAATYTLAFNDATERVTIAAAGGGVSAVSITPTTRGGLIGLTGAVSGGLVHTGQRAPDYVIAAASGFWGETWTGEYEGGEDIAFDVVSHTGRPGGAAKDGAPLHLDFDVPLEPVARVGNMPAAVSSSAPWTWRKFWRHCRNVEPFAMRDDTGLTYGLLLRAEGAAFAPRRLGQGYVERWDLDFRTRVLARKNGSP